MTFNVKLATLVFYSLYIYIYTYIHMCNSIYNLLLEYEFVLLK